MSPKYAPSPAPSDVPAPTEVGWTSHVIGRWDERTPPDAVAPSVAFAHAMRVPGLERHSYFVRQGHGECEAVYVYAGVTAAGRQYTMLFLQTDDGRLVTCYPLESVWHPGVCGQVREVVAEGGRYHE